MKDITNIKDITMLTDMLGKEKPHNPLITLIDLSEVDEEVNQASAEMKVTTGFYSIMIKEQPEGALIYGRDYYDFQEGSLLFIGPNQVIANEDKGCKSGWALFFHPDLIRGTALGSKIDQYSFFDYDINEALHLSDKEKSKLNLMVQQLDEEIKHPIDNHSKTVLVSSLELILNLCMRYYERQFNTRSVQNSDILRQFEGVLKTYYQNGFFAEKGIPSVDYFAEKIHLSPNYLSDLLKKETGHTAKDKINSFIIEKAKVLLLKNNNTVNEVAYELGFNYPHYFSRMFRSKTGMSPVEYRQLN